MPSKYLYLLAMDFNQAFFIIFVLNLWTSTWNKC